MAAVVATLKLKGFKMANKNGSPKKRNKKNCQIKRATQMAIFGTNDLLLVFCGGKEATHALDKKTGTPVHIGQSIAQSLYSIAFKWNVYLAVLCRTQSGEEYIQSEEMNFVHPYRRELLSAKLNEAHDKLIKSCNQQHIVNIGWIASTVPYEFDDQHCDKLFTNQGAWEFLSSYEESKVQKLIPLNPRCPSCNKFVTRQNYRENCMEGGPCSRCKEKLLNKKGDNNEVARRVRA